MHLYASEHASLLAIECAVLVQCCRVHSSGCIASASRDSFVESCVAVCCSVLQCAAVYCSVP